jgi:DNA polymerase-3 subunit gamma/tau
VVDLFEMLLRGDMAGALKELRDQYDSGADPAVILSDLAEFTHFVTRVKLVPAVADDLSLSEAERTRGRDFAAALSMRVLSRTWQMLLKGLTEVQQAGKPIAAAEMLLVRIAYAADLPTPDEALRALTGGGAQSVPARAPASPAPASPRMEAPRGAPRAALNTAPQAVAGAEPALRIDRFEDVVKLAADRRDLQIKAALETDVRLVRCEDGKLEIALEPGASHALVSALQAKLSAWTGRQWFVTLSREQGQPTLRSQAKAREAELKRGVRGDPLVQAVLERFPGAEIVAVRQREDLAGSENAGGEAVPYSDDDDDRNDSER